MFVLTSLAALLSVVTLMVAGARTSRLRPVPVRQRVRR